MAACQPSPVRASICYRIYATEIELPGTSASNMLVCQLLACPCHSQMCISRLPATLPAASSRISSLIGTRTQICCSADIQAQPAMELIG